MKLNLIIFLSTLLFTILAKAKTSTTEIKVQSGQYNLSGQLDFVPESSALVIFFHGSGVQDRWETMPGEFTLDGAPAPIFKPIAQAFNDKGISTLVFDKRGFREKNTPAFGNIGKTLDFETIKADANAILAYAENLKKFKKIYLLGHSEGTIVASELSFDHKDDKTIAGLVLIGVVANNLKDDLKAQMTTIMADNTFKQADLNHDGKIEPKEIPARLKAGLPMNILDKEKKGYITRDDLIKALDDQFNQVTQAVENAPANAQVMGKPVLWFRQLFQRKALLERVSEFHTPVYIIHGELDQNVPYKDNAEPLEKALKEHKIQSELTPFSKYGHCLSPEKNGLPTLGPIQSDAVKAIVRYPEP